MGTFGIHKILNIYRYVFFYNTTPQGYIQEIPSLFFKYLIYGLIVIDPAFRTNNSFCLIAMNFSQNKAKDWPNTQILIKFFLISWVKEKLNNLLLINIHHIIFGKDVCM